MDQLCCKKISIIVPVYNSEKTIEKCIKSLLDLNYPKDEMEIIFIDNGSIDNTLRIFSKYSKNGIKILHQKRRGISLASVMAPHIAAPLLIPQNIPSFSAKSRTVSKAASSPHIIFLSSNFDLYILGTMDSFIFFNP